MNAEGKIHKTLAKKLSESKVQKKVEPKVEQAENKSHFFKELTNRKKFNKNAKIKEKDDTVVLENAIQRSSRRLKPVAVDDTKSSKDIMKIKLVKGKTNRISIKEEDEPSTSKKMKPHLSDAKWQPPTWKIMLENIRNMRSKNEAPVDIMGCHKCADENADDKTQRFHKLIALMLSSQTKDETTYHAMLRLREHNLTPEVIAKMKVNVLENILHPVSFYKNKAKYMQQTCKILLEKYNSDIPNNIKDLVALPGVGPKMAHICMATAWHEVTGIGVDVHVHRISNRMGWLPKPTKEPEETRLALEAWLPQHLWSEVNHLLVGFGQTVCTPVKPKCNECLNNIICPSATKPQKRGN